MLYWRVGFSRRRYCRVVSRTVHPPDTGQRTDTVEDPDGTSCPTPSLRYTVGFGPGQEDQKTSANENPGSTVRHSFGLIGYISLVYLSGESGVPLWCTSPVYLSGALFRCTSPEYLSGVLRCTSTRPVSGVTPGPVVVVTGGLDAHFYEGPLKSGVDDSVTPPPRSVVPCLLSITVGDTFMDGTSSALVGCHRQDLGLEPSRNNTCSVLQRPITSRNREERGRTDSDITVRVYKETSFPRTRRSDVCKGRREGTTSVTAAVVSHSRGWVTG